MTTDEMTVRVQFWPNEAEKMDRDKGLVTFSPTIATIARVFDSNKGVGWKFEEDPDGNIWNGQGRWNNDERTREKYDGPKFDRGQRVRVALQRKKGEKKDFYDVLDIRLASEDEYTGPPAAPQQSYVDKETATASPQASGDGLRDANGQPTVKYWEMNDQQRRVGMAFNNLTTMLASDKFRTQAGDHDWMDLWYRWFSEASRGRPLTPVQDEEPEAEETPTGLAEGCTLKEDGICRGIDGCIGCADPLRDSPDDTFEATAQPEKPVEDDVESLPW